MASLSDPLAKELLTGRYIASLATANADGSIHMVAVWYWYDGANIFVATSARSRKARNLKARPKVSLMIDSRHPTASRGVSIAGQAQLIAGDSSVELNAKIYRKYLSESAIADTRVGPVFAQWDDVTIQIMPPLSVFSWDMRQVDQQVFGGALGKSPGYLLPPER